MADTQELPLTATYQLLIAGPAVVTLETGSIARLHMKTGAGIPADNVPAQRLRSGNGPLFYDYKGTLNIFARKESTDIKDVLLSFLDE